MRYVAANVVTDRQTQGHTRRVTTVITPMVHARRGLILATES